MFEIIFLCEVLIILLGLKVVIICFVYGVFLIVVWWGRVLSVFLVVVIILILKWFISVWGLKLFFWSCVVMWL